ncbi:copper amine oxidase N-terminal domain-containing protein [Paenibacillus sp. RC21]|uniref:copper amine oxidase N-terminal domain-containing protein n=1 Tax=Paenibacillus sp. RC21 TaxID=3156312 RepID=UPI003838274E
MRENWRPYVVTILLLASPLTFGWNHVEAEGADQKEIVLRAGDPSVKINGTEIVLATAPKSIGNSIYVPLRFIGTQLGADVQWLQQEKSVKYETSEMNIQLWIDQKRQL